MDASTTYNSRTSRACAAEARRSGSSSERKERNVQQYKFIGTRYERGRDIKEIAKLVRTDIKEAAKKGRIPKRIKTSVRISRYAGGQSLNVYIRHLGGNRVINPAWVKWHNENPHGYFGDAPPRYTALAIHTRRTIEGIVAAYNFDDSDSQVDYFHCNFYGHVEFDYEMEEADRNLAQREGDYPDKSEKALESEPEPTAEPAKEPRPVIPFPVFNQRYAYYC
jgi:hypothetical protein